MEIGIDHNRHCVILDDSEIKLPSLEYRLFTLLLSSPDKVFSKNEIGAAIWGAEVPDTTIEKLTSRLREHLGFESLETRRGFGYSINLDLLSIRQSTQQERAFDVKQKSGYIYIINVGFDNVYKIGQSIDPLSRCIDGAAFNPRLRMLAYGLSDKPSAHEVIMHNAFDQFNIGRELFQFPGKELYYAINLLNSLCNKDLFIDILELIHEDNHTFGCLLYTSPSPRDRS